MEQRKSDHISIALHSQVSAAEHDFRFHYEPFLQGHPLHDLQPVKFLGKQLKCPIWVSSMTGGTSGAFQINTNLARACREFGMGMGLGSCRTLLDNDIHLRDFDMRDIIGDDLPFYANLGIGQVEQLIQNNQVNRIHELVAKLRSDGLIIHVNPLQEWFQPEGDILHYAPIDTIRRFMAKAKYPVIVKEVGQGIGPASLRELVKLPLAAIEFAAFGGTNFARAELLRGKPEMHDIFEPYTRIGEPGIDMVHYINDLVAGESQMRCREVIVSGGVKNFLDGYYLINILKIPAIYGQASGFLQHAKNSYEDLRSYCINQVNGLKLAHAYLSLRA